VLAKPQASRWAWCNLVPSWLWETMLASREAVALWCLPEGTPAVLCLRPPDSTSGRRRSETILWYGSTRVFEDQTFGCTQVPLVATNTIVPPQNTSPPADYSTPILRDTLE
jgi:hypothetical protein